MTERILLIISNLLNKPVEQLSPEDRFVEDLGLSSLDAIIMLCKIEDEFGISVETNNFPNVSTVEELVRWLQENFDIGNHIS